MERMIYCILMILLVMLSCHPVHAAGTGPKLLYQGHGSLRITTDDGKVIYIDPFAGEGYDLPADLILVSHGHADHTAVDLITDRNEDCQVIYYTDALVNLNFRDFYTNYI